LHYLNSSSENLSNHNQVKARSGISIPVFRCPAADRPASDINILYHIFIPLGAVQVKTERE
jgi:hypothetical protein